MGDRAEEGCVYGNPCNAYRSLGNFLKAIEYHQLHLQFTKEVGDWSREGRTYGNLGKA